MKTTSTLLSYINLIKTTCLLFVLSAFVACSVGENVQGAESKDAGEIAEKAKVSGKERAVKVYPDMVKRIIHVKNVQDRQIDFYVFDTGGAMILHYKMEENEHKKIGDLKRGSYVYQVFGGDEMTDSGKIIVR